MTSPCIDPHNLKYRSATNDTNGFSLSHLCAQISESDTVAELNALLFAAVRLRYGHMMRNHSDLFLDFKENFPHSNLQNDTHDD